MQSKHKFMQKWQIFTEDKIGKKTNVGIYEGKKPAQSKLYKQVKKNGFTDTIYSYGYNLIS